jgi:xylan 1,4-beta-xylosidase
MKSRLTTLVILGLILLTYKVNGQTTFRNPIISGMNPDPSICRVGDDYYLITSTFEYFPGLPIYQSKDLVHWKLIGYILSRASNNPLMGCESSRGGLYAPTIRYHDGTFYVTCTNYGGQGSQGGFYVTAINPAGPWSDPHWVGDWNMDASLMFENDSMYYHCPNNTSGFDGFLLGIINPETGTFYKPLQKIAEGLGGVAPEGPHMYKINDYYYLMSAEGGTGYGHSEVIQRSDSPWGPYEASPINPVVSNRDDPDNPIQAIGHADLVETPDGWWLVCLGIRPKGGNYHHLGRETFLAPVTWDEDGWPKVGTDGIVQEEYPVPDLPQYIWEEDSIRDDFDSTSLRLPWNFVRNPYAADWSLTANPGFLRLNGSTISFKQKDSPAFICRRQAAFNIVASTKISFTPTASNEEAGLVVRGNDKNHYDLLITMLGGARVIMLREYLRDEVVELKYKEIPEGDIILRISATELQYQFWIQQEGKTAELIGSALTKNLSTEVIEGFTGVFIGMYASGNGTENVDPADFDWFDYEEDPVLPYPWAEGPKETQNNMETPYIISATSPSYDQAKIVWNNITNESGYLIERYGDGDTQFDSIGYNIANDTVFTDSGLSGSTFYMYRVIGKNSDGYSYPSVSASVLTLHEPGPYFGTPVQIPGTVEAENYDFGGNNISFFDTDSVNNGGQYRTDEVDIETCNDTGGGYNVGWINDGEWLTYTVDVNDEISMLDVRIASINTGGKLKIILDDIELGTIDIPNTSGWQQWQTVSLSGITIEAGENKLLRLEVVKGGFNINWISFQSATAVEENRVKPGQFKLSNNFLNPFNPETTISYELPYKSYVTLKIYDPLGRLVTTLVDGEESAGRHLIRLNASNFSSGMYFCCLHVGLFTETKKLISLR